MLSDRIRPNSEAAPWVIEEIKRLEAILKHLAKFPMNEFQYRHRDETPIYGFNGWVLTVGDIKEAKKLLGEYERHPSRIVERVQLLTDPAYTPLGTASQTLGKFPIR